MDIVQVPVHLVRVCATEIGIKKLIKFKVDSCQGVLNDMRGRARSLNFSSTSINQLINKTKLMKIHKNK